MPTLAPLPPQRAEVPWPTGRWPETEPGPRVDRETLAKQLDFLFTEPPSQDRGRTKALVVIHCGALVSERYGVEGGAPRKIVTSSPPSGRLRALIWPPCSSAMRFAMGSPRPVPVS